MDRVTRAIVKDQRRQSKERKRQDDADRRREAADRRREEQSLKDWWRKHRQEKQAALAEVLRTAQDVAAHIDVLVWSEYGRTYTACRHVGPGRPRIFRTTVVLMKIPGSKAGGQRTCSCYGACEHRSLYLGSDGGIYRCDNKVSHDHIYRAKLMDRPGAAEISGLAPKIRAMENMELPVWLK